MNYSCYDCAKEFSEDSLYEVEEGTINPQKKLVCYRCKRQREKAQLNEGNWKEHSKRVSFT